MFPLLFAIQAQLLQLSEQVKQLDQPIGQVIIEESIKGGVDPILMLNVAHCEASYKHDNMVGDNGKAYGAYQFHKPTFDAFKKEAGMPELNYEDRNDQIKLAVWGFKNGKAKHWTCYDKVKYKTSNSP